jgi:predicted ester cyclase
MKTLAFVSSGARFRIVAGAVLAVGVTLALGVQAAPALTGQALVDRYRQCWSQFNQKQWAEFASCYGPKSVSVAPGLPEAKGSTAILDKHARPIAQAFPDIAGELQLVVADGKRLMSVALMQGTHTGPLAGPGGTIPATGKKIGLLAAHGVEASGTTAAAREWYMQDAGTMMGQLGLSPAPSRPALAKGAGTTQVVIATGSAQEKANLVAAKKLYAAFNARDKGMAEMVTDDVVDRNQSAPKDVVGKKAVTEFISGFWQMSSDVKVAMPAMWAAGDYVVAVGTFAGVNDGAMPAMGLPRTGKKFKVDIAEISRWKDGKMAELWPFFNGAQLAVQLGLMPPPPAPVTAKY